MLLTHLDCSKNVNVVTDTWCLLLAYPPIISYLMSKQGFGGKRNSQAFKELYMKFQHVDMAKEIPLGMWII